jgi:fibronectin-binding autotransporter adhesin
MLRHDPKQCCRGVTGYFRFQRHRRFAGGRREYWRQCLDGFGRLTLGCAATTGETSFAGVLSGTRGITKNGTYTQTLAGASDYTGTTTINAGIIKTGDLYALGSCSPVSFSSTTPSELVLGSKSLYVGSLSGGGAPPPGPATATISNGTAALATLTTGCDNTTTSYYGKIIDGSGGGELGLTKQGIGNQSVYEKRFTATGPLGIAGKTIIWLAQLDNSSPGKTLIAILEQALDLVFGVATAHAADCNGSGIAVWGWTGLPSTSKYITPASALEADQPFELGGGSIQYSGSDTVITLDCPITLSVERWIYPNVQAFNEGHKMSTFVNDNPNVVLTINGAIGEFSGTTDKGNHDPGGYDFNIDGGTLILANANNTYTGTTKVQTGTLKLGVNQALNATQCSALAIASAGTFNLDGYTGTVKSLNNGTGYIYSTGGNASGSGTITNTGSVQPLTVGCNDGSGTFAGPITGTTGLTKIGTGTLTLTGGGTTSNFSGLTTVTGGTLKLNPASSATYATSVVMNGGTLSIAGATNDITTSGTLQLDENSTIALDNTTTASLKFSGIGAWDTSKKLTITGWATATSALDQSGANGKLFIGDAKILTPSQLSAIKFLISGIDYHAMQLATGEVVATNSLTFISHKTGSWNDPETWGYTAGSCVSGITCPDVANNVIISGSEYVPPITATSAPMARTPSP